MEYKNVRDKIRKAVELVRLLPTACRHDHNLKDEIITLLTGIDKPKTTKQYSMLFCTFMNIMDFRNYGCECHWWPPYGRSIHGGCHKHD